jgi:hypothetical protein
MMDALVTVTDSPAAPPLPPPTCMGPDCAPAFAPACAPAFALRPQAEFRRRHSLGTAILLTAIHDYRSLNQHLHDHAAEFLFPRVRACREHYVWVLSMAEGVNAEWLRDALDRSRKFWDNERLIRKTRRTRERRLA